MSDEPTSGAPLDDDPFVVRRAKLDALRAAGVEPFVNGFEVTARAAAARRALRRARADGAETEDVVTIAGRLVAKRDQGKLAFLVLRDATGEVQLFCRLNVLGDEGFEAAKDLDLGDWVGATGNVLRSRRGELSVQPTEVDAAVQVALVRFPRSTTGSPTPRPAIGSATST